MNSPLHAYTFYGILDTGYVPTEKWISKYDDLVRGGAGIIQIRAKGKSQSEHYKLTERLVEHRAKNSSAQPHLISNVDIDLALSFPDLGLHIGQNTIDAEEARERLGPNRLIGQSALTPKQVRETIDLAPGILDYFSIGPVFATKTKPNAKPAGLEFVKYVSEQTPQIPFFCIGGIHRGNISEVVSAGGKRIISVSDVLCDSDTSHAVQESIQLASG